MLIRSCNSAAGEKKMGNTLSTCRWPCGAFGRRLDTTAMMIVGATSVFAGNDFRQVVLDAGDLTTVTSIVPLTGPTDRPDAPIDLMPQTADGGQRGEDWQPMSVPGGLYLRAIS